MATKNLKYGRVERAKASKGKNEGKNGFEILSINFFVLAFVVAGIFISLSGSVNAYNVEGGGVCNCSSCADCTNALHDNTNCSSQVKLIADITNQAGTCINNPANFNNKIFDCQGHIIEGNGISETWPDVGIYINGKTRNTIKNCIITKFSEGIYLYSSSNNTITNNTLNDNSYYGIILYSSSSNTITNNTANNNNNYGILIYISSNYNTITNNTANNNGYHGIYIYVSSNYNTITNNTANNNKYGIYLLDNSNFNKILSNKILNNSEKGIVMSNYNIWGEQKNGNSNNTIEDNEILNNKIGIFSNSSNSTINRNVVCGNTQLDFNSSDWLSSYGSNNICNNSDGWNDAGTTGCTHRCGEISTVNCTCNSCSECTEKLNNASCTEVYLTADIVNQTGTCIDNPANFNNKIFDCQGHKIERNRASENWPNTGIYIYEKTGNTIRNCIITKFDYGIYLESSSNNTITNNAANNNNHGIYLESSSNNIMRNNTMNNKRYNFGIDGEEISHFYQDIDTSNKVDEKPIYYWTNKKNAPNNCKNAEINELNNAGFVALVSCDNITVKNLNLSKNEHGILLVNTTNSKILNNTANNNSYGIYLSSSSNNTITNNTANNNRHYTYGGGHGIVLGSSSNNILTNNTANNNREYGIDLGSSSNNILTNNTANNNSDDGILLFSSSNNTITNNTANNNYHEGIILSRSSNNTIINNTANNNSFGILLLTSSNNNLIINNTANNNNHGIQLDNSLNNTIEDNEILNNNFGIFSDAYSSSSTINRNVVCGNTRWDFFYPSNWPSSYYGSNNTCNKSDGWNDTGTTGCTYHCGERVSECTCNSCFDCNAKLNDASCKIVYLTADITNQFGACINNPENFNNKTFDCQGHKIDGKGVYDGGLDAGIYIKEKTGNTIKNCIITKFVIYGIYLSSSSNNIITNNIANNNKRGISLSSSSNNIITNNIANNNKRGIYLFSSSNNTITNNIANNNNWDAILLLFSSSNNITNNTANNNWEGIYLVSSSSNTMTNNTVKFNQWYGIYASSGSSGSTGNIITLNTFCSNNYYDIYNGDAISGYNNTCNTFHNYNDAGTTTGCTYHCV